eukprot:CAMPEP_0201595354 /NCGR_PEP_ID=MMETSP0190_2-20130828/192379_1 /ASSEMBLY_ACC=CAM_ASM_000263 /TAXON_ID=37353 /ORGANISM="Rosalina sp." /LENGTH=498 /DNA_ID=CAMNT_0048055299 /DNA_START=75 /DNA_END=1568 /DNA_ORIENTATION=+
MSLFDPLYQIESNGPPSLSDINQVFSEFDGSGSGIMTAKQMYAACRSITNLGFTDTELQNYIKEAMDVAGDGSGKIKTGEFASYLAFEAKKAYKKKQNAANSNGSNGANGNNVPNGSTKLRTTNSAGAANGDYQNPFLDFLSGDQPQPKKPQLTSSASMKITLTPDPKQTQAQANEKRVDMSASFSPTESDPTDLPNWFGHSVDTITTHPNEPSANPWDLFDDDKKTNSNGLNHPKPNHMSIATQDILFEDDTTTTNGNSSSNGVSKSPNLSPKRAKNLRRNMHATSKSTTGLIAPPRAKGDKAKTSKKKKKNHSSKHSAAVSASFSNLFEDYTDDWAIETPKKEKKKEKQVSARDRLKLKKAHSEMVPESTHKLVSKNPPSKNDGKKKKKRPKIDAIVEMKRGAAMLKYGRRGFPHFRRFQISHDLTKLLWYSRKKSLNETHVAIKEMKDILDGQQTEVFKQCTQKTLEKASFSIIYGSKLKSLDVVAKSAEEAQLW